MEKQENQDINYQFLWTVPPQPLVNTQTVVETYQNKIPLDLNVSSTDTTAISSFALSVIIALILGCLATWLAYWFGVRSFKLTEMSFDILKQEIEHDKKIRIEKELRDYGAEYIQLINEFLNLAEFYDENYLKLPYEERFEKNSKYYDHFFQS